MNWILQIFSWMVLVASIFDSYKYKFLSYKISKLKSSGEISRKFINISILYRILLLIYSYFILHDWVITWSCIIALYTLFETFYFVYTYYPYRQRGLKNFRKPSLLKYIWNSILPNSIRQKL